MFFFIFSIYFFWFFSFTFFCSEVYDNYFIIFWYHAYFLCLTMSKKIFFGLVLPLTSHASKCNFPTFSTLAIFFSPVRASLLMPVVSLS